MSGIDILMIAACTIVWFSVVVAFRWLIPFSMVWYIILLSLLVFVGYLFAVYYSPIKTDYDVSISNAKQDYLNNKDKLDQVYVDQLKTDWKNDTMDRNKYFILMFIVLCYLPVPYYVIYLMGHNPKQYTPLDHFMESWVTVPMTLAMMSLIGIVAVLLWGIYTFGIMYMLYILLSVVVGVGLFWFVIFYKQWLSLPKAFGIIALLGIIAMLVLAVTVMGWMNMVYGILAIIVVGLVAGILLQ
jgi:MFS family permease